ncbi:MAG TPA: hypothetical protein VJ770_11095 [Stellaceae bacterium]|nr:hypothetical protein [Stellaceae bacterium]
MACKDERERLVAEVTVLEGRLIAARHLHLDDRVRLLESEKARLERRLAALQTEGAAPPGPSPARGRP